MIMNKTNTNTNTNVSMIYLILRNIIIFLIIIGLLAIIYKIIDKCYNKYILKNNYDYFDSDDEYDD